MNGHMFGKGGPLGPLAGGCGSGIGPPLFVGGIPGIPLNPGSIGKGGSLIPGLSPNMFPGPSSFIGDRQAIYSHYNFVFIFAIKFLDVVTRSLHLKRPRHTDVPTPRAATFGCCCFV